MKNNTKKKNSWTGHAFALPFRKKKKKKKKKGTKWKYNRVLKKKKHLRLEKLGNDLISPIIINKPNFYKCGYLSEKPTFCVRLNLEENEEDRIVIGSKG